MKRIKKALTGCICILAIVFLAAYGLGWFDKGEAVDMEKEETEQQGERRYQEEFGMEYPAIPKESGVEISYEEDLKLPSDDSLKNLYVYEFHDIFGENEVEKQEKYANLLAKKILKDYFPGERWERTVVSDAYQDNYVYRIQEKEKNGFQYTANKDGIDNTQLICEKGQIVVPISENENYNEAYQKFSMELLEYFQAGLWDGENVHMVLTDTKDISETGGYYRYMIELDGIRATECHGFSFANNFNSWAAFHYEDGSLISMFQMAERVLDGKRECKPQYSDMDEAMKVIKQGLEIYYKQEAKNFYRYYVANVKDVSLEYMEYIEKDGTACYVPILRAYIQEGVYYISEQKWEWRETGYAVQLETGETGAGHYKDSAYGWQAPMTDKLEIE